MNLRRANGIFAMVCMLCCGGVQAQDESSAEDDAEMSFFDYLGSMVAEPQSDPDVGPGGWLDPLSFADEQLLLDVEQIQAPAEEAVKQEVKQ